MAGRRSTADATLTCPSHPRADRLATFPVTSGVPPGSPGGTRAGRSVLPLLDLDATDFVPPAVDPGGNWSGIPRGTVPAVTMVSHLYIPHVAAWSYRPDTAVVGTVVCPDHPVGRLGIAAGERRACCRGTPPGGLSRWGAGWIRGCWTLGSACCHPGDCCYCCRPSLAPAVVVEATVAVVPVAAVAAVTVAVVVATVAAPAAVITPRSAASEHSQ